MPRAAVSGRLGMRSCVLGLVLAVCSLAASAQSLGELLTSDRPYQAAQTGARAVTVSPGARVGPGSALLADLLSRRTVEVHGPPTQGSVLLRDLLNGPSPSGQGSIQIEAKRPIPWSAVAKGAAKALPLISTAVAIQEIYEALRCRERFGGGAECDFGQDEETVEEYVWRATVTGFAQSPGDHPSPSAAITAAFAHRFGTGSSCTGSGSFNDPRTCIVRTLGVVQVTGPGSATASITACQTITAGGNVSGPTCSTMEGAVSASRYAPTVIERCPAVPPGSGFYPPRGIDGKCPTGDYQPASEPQVAQRVEQYADKTKAPAIVAAGMPAGIPFEHQPATFEGPGTVSGGRQTTRHPDGSTTTRDVDHPMEYTPDGYRWQDREVVRVWPPGTEPEAPGTPPGASTPPGTVTEGGTSPQPIEVITCGLPGKPPCKIDETGTPTGQGVESGSVQSVEALELGQIGLMTTGQQVALPWLWALELPSGACSALTFELHGRGFTLDLCNNALVSFWRSLLAWALAAWSALYVWRSVTEATGGR